MSIDHTAATQDDVGWGNFVCGRVALLTRGHVEAHLRMVPTSLTATSWCCGFVTRLLELAHKQWTARNDFVHGTTEQGAKRKELTQLRDSITAELLEGSDTLLPEFRALFNESFEALSGSPFAASSHAAGLVHLYKLNDYSKAWMHYSVWRNPTLFSHQ